MTDKVSIRAHFERFPVSVKGAFVMRGADRDPHQVRIDAADVFELAGRGRFSVGLQKLTLDVAPKLDLFVPFEFPVTELGPGWYGLECKVTIDGDAAVVRPGKRFAVPWPRASVRRGAVPVGKAVDAAGATLRLDQVDCAPLRHFRTDVAPIRAVIGRDLNQSVIGANPYQRRAQR